MQKAEPQHGHTQNQPAAKQGGTASVETPQGEHIAQLEAMMDSSPQAQKLAGLAAMMNNSPAMAAQRKLFESIHNSPLQTAQRRKFDSLFGTAQRVGDEGPLQPKLASKSPAQFERQPAPKPNNTGLPDNLKSGIENLSGISMDNVKVHYNSSQPAQLNALAYAQGTDIHVAPGQEQHLPHEAWHVVQQAQGRVRPTMQMKGGVPVNDDTGLEHEANVMGGRALQTTGGVAGIRHSASRSQGTPPAIVQRLLEKPTDEAIRKRFHTQISRVKGMCDEMAAKVAGKIRRWNSEYTGERNGYSIAWWEFSPQDNDYCGMNHTAAIINTASGEYVIDTTHKQFSGASGDDIYIGTPQEWMAYIVRINNGQGLVYADRIKKGYDLSKYEPPPQTKPEAPQLEVVDKTEEEMVSVEKTKKKKSGSCAIL